MIKKIFISYCFILSIFTLLIIIVFIIPTVSIKQNIAASAKQIQKEGLWFQPFGFYLFQIDNMTDCLMMNINACADSDHPVEAAMTAKYVLQSHNNNNKRIYKNLINNTLDISTNEYDKSTEMNSYARYWHGYQIILRPLLTFLNYNQIRILNYIIFTVLMVITIIMLYKTSGKIYALTFFATMVISNIMIVPLAIQFSICFYISMIAMLVFLIRPELSYNNEKTAIIFFITGAITSYMDFLTTPLLTLGFPLIVTTSIAAKQNNKIKNIAMKSISWFSGYTLLWASKWIIAWILTGENVIYSAINSAQLRIGNTIVFGGNEMQMDEFFNIITKKISLIINPLLILFIIFVLIIIIATYFYKNRQRIKEEGWLITIALMPLLWFIVMKNHSLQHIFFTWRDWILTLWCMMIFVFYNKKKQSNYENSRTHTMLQ